MKGYIVTAITAATMGYYLGYSNPPELPKSKLIPTKLGPEYLDMSKPNPQLGSIEYRMRGLLEEDEYDLKTALKRIQDSRLISKTSERD